MSLEPPLVAIRAFEAAARHGSFTAAARELGITQGAVSRHVRTLEDIYGLRLFDRRGRAVVLTVAGQSLFEPVEEALALIRRASRQLHASRDRVRTLTVSLLPSVAALWLAPRLAEFTAANPRLELRIHASRGLIDFSSEHADVAIRYGLGVWPGAVATLLATEQLSPVCSPEFAREHRLGADPSAITHLPLLTEDLPDQWSDWCTAANVAVALPNARLKFDDSTSLYHAAASGRGLALGRSFLVERALKEGALVEPFAISIPASYSYWVVLPDRGTPSPATRLFVDWLRQQAALQTSGTIRDET